MKADITRDTFTPPTDRRTVRFQQGRLPLDADLNEGQDLLISRVETEALDVIGSSGGPENAAGFEISTADAGKSLVAGEGRYYVDGVLCRLDEDTPLTEQDDLPGFELPGEKGLYLAYLDVSFDHLTAREDDSIQEVALNGADTATRQRVKSQVRLLKISDAPGDSFPCDEDLKAWDDLVAEPTGRAAARAEPEEIPENECSMTPGAGYRSLLNQLYRLEIHQPGDHDSATCKWSRENCSILAHWQEKIGDDLILEPQGRDPHRLFTPTGWVELIDRERELREEPGTLVQVVNVRDNILTIDPATATGPVDLASFETLPRVRRWESPGALPLNHDPDADGFSPLEFGVQVRFAKGTYRTGDYWLIPARTATGDVEWPRDDDGVEILQPRRGIRHHYARLAVLRFDAEIWSRVDDCRNLFPPLTELDHCNLKLHNKHLHGKGVVCGLQVHCDGDGDVLIQKGHAIDCEGTDILHKRRAAFPVVDRAGELDLLDQGGNGEALLILTAGADDKPEFGLRAAPEDPKGFKNILEHILEGTLWMDFYRDCLRPLVDFVKDRFVDDEDEGGVPGSLVSEKKKDLVTVANLTAHQRGTGPYRRLWLSKDQHQRLKKFYDGLLKFAAGNKTFCGAADDFAPFPNYPFGSRPIGVGFAARRLNGVRVSPNGRRAFAWSDEHPGRLFVFDLEKGGMTHHLEIESAEKMTVRDVAFATFRKIPSVLVLSTNNTFSVISALDPKTLQESAKAAVLQGGVLNTMRAHPLEDTILIAVQPGVGVHFLNLNGIRSRSMPKPVWNLPATGHLAIGGDHIAVTAAVGDNVLPPGVYNAVFFGELGPGGDDSLGEEHTFIRSFNDEFSTGSDGLAIVQSDQGLALHLVVDPPKGVPHKSVIIADAISRKPLGTRDLPIADDGSDETGPVRLLGLDRERRVVYALTNRNQLFWASSSPSNVQLLRSSIPAQAGPVALASGGPTAKSFVAAHHESMTLTLVNSDFLDKPTIQDATLGNYRDALIDAFQSVLIPVVQSLKDCLCDKLLIDCPECGKDDFIPLARIEIREKAVYHICNRARQELLTFPKVTYWLSAVPILPLVGYLVDKFCCWILPVPEPPDGGGTVPGVNFAVSEALVAAVQTGNASKFDHLVRNSATRLGAIGRLTADKAALEFVSRSEKESVGEKGVSDIIGRNSEGAIADLKNSGIEVGRVVPYEKALRHESELLKPGALPGAVRRGDRVELFTRGDKVVFFRRVPPKPAVSGIAEDASEFQAKLDVLKEQLLDQESTIAALKKTRIEENENRQAKLLELQRAAKAESAKVVKLEQANTELATELSRTVKDLREEIKTLRKRLPPG